MQALWLDPFRGKVVHSVEIEIEAEAEAKVGTEAEPGAAPLRGTDTAHRSMNMDTTTTMIQVIINHRVVARSIAARDIIIGTASTTESM